AGGQQLRVGGGEQQHGLRHRRFLLEGPRPLLGGVVDDGEGLAPGSPRSQWRDRAGLAPASCTVVAATGTHRGYAGQRVVRMPTLLRPISTRPAPRARVRHRRAVGRDHVPPGPLSLSPAAPRTRAPDASKERTVERSPRKAAASGWVGSALEYYDFFIYAQAAALVFPAIFFPQGDPAVGVVASLATFGVGYVARPLGAFVLGHWGDKHGRKNVLVLCMLMMGVSTFLVALLPTYESVGVPAPALLVVLRLIQGFAVGGEISGASAMIVEHAPFGRRGFYASFTLQGVQAGQILAAAVFLPMSAPLPADAFQAWGWRVPFLLSALVVVAGYLVRRRVDETPAFRAEQEQNAVPKAPIVQVVRENGRDVLRVVLMALMNIVPTTTTVFGASYATSKAYGLGFSATTYLWISVVGNVVAVLLIP